MLKPTTQTLALDDYVNVNAYIGSFPALISDNKDSPRWKDNTRLSENVGKRYREYLLGSSIRGITTVFYLPREFGDPGGAFNNVTLTYGTCWSRWWFFWNFISW